MTNYHLYPLVPRRFSPDPHLFFGLDLGRRQDHSALVILERAVVPLQRRDPVTWEELSCLRFILRHAERLPLGLPYLQVVHRIHDLIHHTTEVLPGDFEVLPGHPINPHKTLAVDATGVGAPIVEILRQLDLRARLIPITITSGSNAAEDPFGGYRVPRRDLLTQLRILLERRMLAIPATVSHHHDLHEELINLRDTPTPRRDDLALALALAAWTASKGLNLCNF
jgi:hypothetical protein